MNFKEKTLYVAPMMAWTDRHCRYLHRLYAPNAVLFTEMVTTGALIHGKQWHLLDYNAAEQPLVLQLGGNNPQDLAHCAQLAEHRGYSEVNLNVGCPSDRVQRGTFGACLMRQPDLVAACVKAMRDVCAIPITVKCRLGVDDEDSDELLDAFVETVAAGGCNRFYLHARKAILGGLSPAQNRSIPPLQPHRVERVKRQHPHLDIVINGGIIELENAAAHLQWADGVMIGRAAYHNPAFLRELHLHLYPDVPIPDNFALLQQYRNYVDTQLQAGTRLHAMTRHLLSTCNSRPGAKRFRQLLSDSKRLKTNNIQLLDEAVAQVYPQAA